MSFRRSGQSEERRRRVLREERPSSALANVDDQSAQAPEKDKEAANRKTERPKRTAKRAYTAAALVEGQLRLIDLIPVRSWTVTVIVLVTLTAIAGLDALYTQWPAWSRAVGGASQLAFLDIGARDSLAGWFSSMLLAFAACQCLFVYCLRRYRADDYRGRYRTWLTIAGLFLLASADAVAGWERAFHGLAALLPTASQSFSPLWIGRGMWALVFFACAARMAIEMRRSIGSVTMLGLGGFFYAVALALQAPALAIATRDLATLARITCLLLGHAAMFFTAMLYARRVFLEAHGETVPAAGAAKARKRKVASKERTDDKLATERKEQPTGGKAAPSSSVSSAPAARSAAEEKSAAAEKAAAPAAKPNAAPVTAKAAAPAVAKAEPSATVKSSPLGKLLGSKPAAAAATAPKPASAPSTSQATPVFKPVGDDDDDGEEDEGDSDGGQKLSKAERRRLKKEQRRDRRAAA